MNYWLSIWQFSTFRRLKANCKIWLFLKNIFGYSWLQIWSHCSDHKCNIVFIKLLKTFYQISQKILLFYSPVFVGCRRVCTRQTKVHLPIDISVPSETEATSFWSEIDPVLQIFCSERGIHHSKLTHSF